jgi:hypothetical protein
MLTSVHNKQEELHTRINILVKLCFIRNKFKINILPPTLCQHCPPSWKMFRTLCFPVDIGLAYNLGGEVLMLVYSPCFFGYKTHVAVFFFFAASFWFEYGYKYQIVFGYATYAATTNIVINILNYGTCGATMVMVINILKLWLYYYVCYILLAS